MLVCRADSETFGPSQASSFPLCLQSTLSQLAAASTFTETWHWRLSLSIEHSAREHARICAIVLNYSFDWNCRFRPFLQLLQRKYSFLAAWTAVQCVKISPITCLCVQMGRHLQKSNLHRHRIWFNTWSMSLSPDITFPLLQSQAWLLYYDSVPVDEM